MTDAASEVRIITAHVSQDYDADPPRCATCVYCRREPRKRYVERAETARKGRGKVKIRRFLIKGHPINNPTVDKCTFGNFEVKRTGVCNEWHSRDGERIVDALMTVDEEAQP